MTIKTVNELGNQCLNDFYVYGNSGATRGVFVNNVYNVAASDAKVITAAGGPAGGDAYYQASVTAGGIWTWGIDNSVSDKFVVSSGAALGTTDVMEVYSTGEINYPLQPAFMAYADTQNNVLGDGTFYKVIFANPVFDQGSNFDGVSTFTAPVTGIYLMGTTIAIGAAPFLVGNSELDITLVTTGGSFILNTVNPFNCASAATFYKSTNSVLVYMVSGDTAYINVFVNGAAKTVSIENISAVNVTCTFWGHLVA
jgi:hypothetical protein